MPDADGFDPADQHLDPHILLKGTIKKLRMYESLSFYNK